jgi:uncharacterized protein (TIGR03435 family)
MRCAVRVGQAAVCAILECAIVSAQSPAAEPRFEVASVKPAAHDGPGGGPSPMMRQVMRDNRLPGAIPMADPGRIRLENWPLLDLIAAAYSVKSTQVSGPAWISDQGFDIEAKVPEGTSREQLNAMLQSLLEERFGLKVHRNTQTKQGFALVVGKNGPKLRPEEPPPQDLTPEQLQARAKERVQALEAARMKRVEGEREDGPSLGAVKSESWPSITTEQLATRLVRFTEAPVVDQTGLTGKYSLTVKAWSNPEVPGGTIFDAVEKLGLKLEPRKVSVETVVVDQVSKTPTAN